MTMLIPTRRKKEDHDLGFGSFPVLSSWLDDIFNDNFEGGFPQNFNKGISLPAVNIKDNEDEFIVEMAIPGMTKEDFEVKVENQVLSISSETKTEKEDETENFTRREFGYSSFKRSFTLPKTVNSEKISANYVDGILKVVLPKLEEAKKKPIQTIQVT